MKAYITIALFFSLTAQASDIGISGCGTYSFKGTPRILDKSMILVINEGSNSEFVLEVSRKEQAKLAPYIKLMTSGELVIKEVRGPRRALVGTFRKLDYAP